MERRNAQKKVLLARDYVPDLLRLLRDEKDLRLKEIVERTGLPASTLSGCMIELVEAGLIASFTRHTSSGTYKTYRLLQEGLACCEAEPPSGQYWTVEIPEDARPLLERGFGPDLDGTALQKALTSAIDRTDSMVEKLLESTTEQLWIREARENLDEARQLGGALEQTARENGMELYFAIGKYLAKLAEFQELTREPREYERKHEDRHFEVVMEALYKRKTIPLTEMVETLGINCCNTLIHMKRLVKAGYVIEGSQGRRRLYHLSEAGEKYYEQRLPAAHITT